MSQVLASSSVLVSSEQLESCIDPDSIRKQFNASQISHFRGVFAAYDSDCSGTIDEEELAKVIKQLEPGASDGMIRTMVAQFLEADENGSSAIDFEDFMTMVDRARHEGEVLGSNNSRSMWPWGWAIGGSNSGINVNESPSDAPVHFVENKAQVGKVLWTGE